MEPHLKFFAEKLICLTKQAYGENGNELQNYFWQKLNLIALFVIFQTIIWYYAVFCSLCCLHRRSINNFFEEYKTSVGKDKEIQSYGNMFRRFQANWTDGFSIAWAGETNSKGGSEISKDLLKMNSIKKLSRKPRVLRLLCYWYDIKNKWIKRNDSLVLLKQYFHFFSIVWWQKIAMHKTDNNKKLQTIKRISFSAKIFFKS